MTYTQIQSAGQKNEISPMDHLALFPSEQDVVSSRGFGGANDHWPGPLGERGDVVLRQDEACDIIADVRKERFSLQGAMPGGFWIEKITVEYSVNDHKFEWGASDTCDGVTSGDKSTYLFLTGTALSVNSHGDALGAGTNAYTRDQEYIIDHFELKDMHGQTFEQLRESYGENVTPNDVIAFVNPRNVTEGAQQTTQQVKIDDLANHPIYFNHR